MGKNQKIKTEPQHSKHLLWVGVVFGVFCWILEVVVYVLVFGVFYWILEAVMNVFVFEKGNIFQQIFPQNPIDFWMRLLPVFILSLFIIYVRNLINKQKNAKVMLRKERNELEKQIEERTVELSKSNRLLKKEKILTQLFQAQRMETVEGLVKGISHDFNNLMTVVRGFIDIGMKDAEGSDTLRKDLQKILGAVNRANDLVRQLFFFSCKHLLCFTSLDLNRTFKDLLLLLKSLVGKNILIEIELEPGLWKVWADQGSVMWVIVNLVLNAKNAMSRGGKLTIKTENIVSDKSFCRKVAQASPGKFVCLTVSDTGVGIGKENLRHVFEPFFSINGAHKGSGLGLSVVYDIVKKHNGWIDVSSESGQGTVFRIYLPAVASVQEKGHRTISLIKSLRGGGKRVLVVDDEEGVRKFATRALMKNGYNVFEASDAKEAMVVFEKEKGNFDLVMSDVMLPGKNGIELVYDFLSRKPKIRVLFCSGYTDHKFHGSMVQKNGFQFLQKPYTLSTLLQTVKEAMK